MTNFGLKKSKLFISTGFTIIELLVVIVVIGILATITIVSYRSITEKAVVENMKADLGGASTQLMRFYADNGEYPADQTAIENCPNTDSNMICAKISDGNTYIYTSSSQNYNLCVVNTNGKKYCINNNSSTPTIPQPITCPTNFIVVPGSAIYGTNDFCVMKYEAKILGNDVGSQTYNSSFVADSRTNGTPWVFIQQGQAIAEAQNYPDCTGCHLITEAEWMTLAQNVLSVPSNWSGGVVGSGYIYSGHNDSNPLNVLLPVTNPNDGYSDTGNVSPSNQRRTLTLTNGEVIWDMAGNVQEWTSGETASGQPGITGETTLSTKEWTATPMTIGTLAVNPFPSNTGISGANTWTSANGIGQLTSNAGSSTLYGFMRGGHRGSGASGQAGVLQLAIYYPPTGASNDSLGFRVSK